MYKYSEIQWLKCQFSKRITCNFTTLLWLYNIPLSKYIELSLDFNFLCQPILESPFLPTIPPFSRKWNPKLFPCVDCIRPSSVHSREKINTLWTDLFLISWKVFNMFINIFHGVMITTQKKKIPFLDPSTFIPRIVEHIFFSNAFGNIICEMKIKSTVFPSSKNAYAYEYFLSFRACAHSDEG